MSAASHQRRRVAVIGGGITGLAAAHRLAELDPATEVRLFEAGDKLGGVLQTVRRDGYLLERSADNFITNVPWGLELCQRIGLGEELLPTDESRRQAFVVHRGRLEKLPEGFLLMAPTRLWPVLTTPLLSLRGKARLAWEYFVPRRTAEDDESLASFATRRFGREVFERLVQPLVGGIYTADPQQLSVAATMPRFPEMERRYGSLIRGAWRTAGKNAPGNSERSESGARYGMFVAPRDGMSSLVEALAARLPEGTIRLNAPVRSLTRQTDGRWSLTVEGSTDSQLFDAVIITIPAPAAARLITPVDAPLAELLAGIPYAGASVVSLGYRREQIQHALDGFGFVVPAVEGRKILAGSFSSVKFPGRAPQGRVLIRVFVGGALQADLADLPDDQLRELAARELDQLLGIDGPPELVEITRWRGAMPQYHLGHQARVEQIEARCRELPGLELAGNAYHGVGIPNCIHSGERAAERWEMRNAKC